MTDIKPTMKVVASIGSKKTDTPRPNLRKTDEYQQISTNQNKSKLKEIS